MFKVNNRNIRKRWIKTPEDVVDAVLVFLLLTLNIFHTFSSVSIVDFQQVNGSWAINNQSTSFWSPFVDFEQIQRNNLMLLFTILNRYLPSDFPQGIWGRSLWRFNAFENILILASKIKLANRWQNILLLECKNHIKLIIIRSKDQNLSSLQKQSNVVQKLHNETSNGIVKTKGWSNQFYNKIIRI